jgi:hypothetical protein
MPNFMRIRPVEAELFRADGQTDKTDRRNEANSPFSQYYDSALKIKTKNTIKKTDPKK